jgi:pilus assembly protein CpaB
MNRSTRTIIVIALALVAATAASAAVYGAIRRIPVREVEVAHDYVVVAARSLPLGTRVAASDVKRVGWPSSSPLSGGFSRIEDVVGRGVVTAVGANEPLTEGKLAPKEAGAGLSPAIPPGMRAISVKVNEVIGVAGFATPGARVDVLVTLRRSEDSITRVLVSNVPVLTAGTRYDQEQISQSKPIPATVVTLMVTPSQAEQIALASAEGQIALTLRNPLDVEQPPTAGARLTGLVGARAPDARAAGTSGAAAVRRSADARPAAAAEALAAAPLPVPAGYTIEAIRAGKRTQETIE